MLLAECAAAGVDVRVAHSHHVDRESGPLRRPYRARATSRPALSCWRAAACRSPRWARPALRTRRRGASASRITQTRPALVPFTAKVPELSGVALDVVARCGKASFREAMLFTHRGLSGPAILQISSYWKPGQEISVDLLPDLDAAQFLKERRHARPKAELRTILAEVMPQRLAAVLAEPGRGDPERLARDADRHRRLRQGGSHPRRHRHAPSSPRARWKRARSPACS